MKGGRPRSACAQRDPPARHPPKPLSGAPARRQLERARAICLSLPDATEKVAWGAPTFRVRNKLFAMFADHHHGDSRIALWCHARKGAQEVLAGSEPERFFRPPYVGPSGWVGVDLQAIGDERLAGIVREAYCVVAPMRLQVLAEAGKDSRD